MRPANLLIIMSDEHRADCLGPRGHRFAATPNLDRLAARGTAFGAAYTNSPICVPARASFATGHYVHRIGYWDNAIAYDGAVPGWGHFLQEAGVAVESIGKLHYRRAEDPAGFDAQHLAMHVKDGLGQIWGLLRDPPRADARRANEMLRPIGPGRSRYNAYDEAVAAGAVDWLRARGREPGEAPWVLFVGLVAPHFPLTVPAPYMAHAPPDAMTLPRLHPSTGYVRHPWLQAQAEAQPVDEQLSARERLLATACYYGLCGFLDAQVGRMLAALEETGLGATTRVVYTSDHGENLGMRGMWGKSNLYGDAARIPMILAGPDVPEGRISATPATLVDLAPTILAGVGLTVPEDLPGESLWDIVRAPDDRDRQAFSEYHAVASRTGGFMLRRGRFKYHYYVDYPPELFDLREDPGEARDLAADPDYAAILAESEIALRRIVDPEEADARAKTDQRALIARHGGPDAVAAMGTRGATPVPQFAARPN